jgi:hypothetical protein
VGLKCSYTSLHVLIGLSAILVSTPFSKISCKVTYFQGLGMLVIHPFAGFSQAIAVSGAALKMILLHLVASL